MKDNNVLLDYAADLVLRHICKPELFLTIEKGLMIPIKDIFPFEKDENDQIYIGWMKTRGDEKSVDIIVEDIDEFEFTHITMYV